MIDTIFLDNDIYDIISSHYSQKSIQNKIYRIKCNNYSFFSYENAFRNETHVTYSIIKIIKSQFFHPKSHQYYHSSQNTRHLNRKKIFIHLLFFIRYNSKLSISCHGKKYTYIKKEKRRKYSHRIKIAQTNVVTSRVKRSRLIYRKA